MRSRISLFPYFSLNSPPLDSEYIPRHNTMATDISDRQINIKTIVFMKNTLYSPSEFV